MPYIELDNGYKIHYVDKGKGRILVYIHGFLGSSWIYEELIEYFSKKYHVIAIDHIGHGMSDKPDSESYELTDLAKYLEQTLSKIIGEEKIIFLLFCHWIFIHTRNIKLTERASDRITRWS